MMISQATGQDSERNPHRSAGPNFRVRVARRLPTLVLLGVAVYVLLPQIATFRNSLHVVQTMSAPVVAFAVGAQFLSYMGYGYMLSSLLATVGNRISVLRSALVVLATSSIGLVAGGFVGTSAATYRLTSRAGTGTAGAFLVAGFPPLFNSAVLLIVSLAGVLELLIIGKLSRPVEIIIGAAAVLLCGLAVTIVWGGYHRTRLLKFAETASRRWARFRHRAYDRDEDKRLARVFRAWDLFTTGEWKGPALGAVLNSLFDMLTLYLLFVAAGHVVKPGILLAGYGIALLVAKFTFVPGGIGVVDGGMVAIYAALGVPDAVSVVVVIAYRILSFWLPTLAGFPLYFYLEHAWRIAPHAAGDEGSGELPGPK
jgi:uncharacterized protein (TIRG00374 family)